jgi:hypothetical protein
MEDRVYLGIMFFQYDSECRTSSFDFYYYVDRKKIGGGVGGL